MKNFLLLFVLCFFTSLKAQEYESFPSFEVTTLDGKVVDLKKQLDPKKNTIIIIWATWNSPSKKMLDEVNEVKSDWEEQYNAEIITISIDNNRTSAKVKPILDSKGFDFKTFLDPEEQSTRIFNLINGGYIIVNNGAIKQKYSGYHPGIINDIDEALKTFNNN